MKNGCTASNIQSILPELDTAIKHDNKCVQSPFPGSKMMFV